MRSFIVIVSPSYGGAEKRFFDIFTALRRRGDDVALIAPSSLVVRLREDHPDRKDLADALISIDLPAWSRLAFMRRFRTLLKQLPRGAHFHYPLNCLWPLHLGRGDRITMSVADCTSVPGPLSRKRTDVWAWVAFHFCERIDVLSPAVYDAMKRGRHAPRMSLTPGGTFLVPPAPATGAKRPTAVFLGRLVPGKGLDALLDVLPATWTLLRDRVPSDFEILIAGYGTLEEHVATRAAALRERGVPVTFVGYAEANTVLAPAAVALSMQDTTNFPSRVVAEALMAGCGVIVRDTGDSRQFGEDLPGLAYCGAQLQADELAGHLATLTGSVLNDAAFRERTRAAAMKRFCSPGYLDYFHSVLFGGPVALPSHLH
jgi:glycosyltransferase involved in cell wall biosynthesis